MKKFFLLSFAALLLATGCSGSSEPEQLVSMPVLKYEVGSSDWTALNAFSPGENVLEAYQFAVDHPEVLDYMPCYCGCYESDGHTSNTHCFVDKVEDNVAVLDNMGLG
ncbi:hypothetical protein J2Z37_001693 [Ammoniphilus resinae]|uniref:Lipoprotein n=2 Tax=Ammoniphilus resinae TaxID=861532 RepID=A0ABS4GNJ7_9BACL|nr:hypothetical protein [Ammoniphilus resinae]